MVQKDKKAKAIALRSRGKSYGEIMKELDIPSKGTLSYWFQDLTLSSAAQDRLSQNIEMARKRGLYAFNQRRSKAVYEENRVIVENSKREIEKISQHELILIGAALYWGEGFKKVPSRGYPYIAFANSDPDMVRVFMCYLRQCLQVEDKKIKPGVMLHPNNNVYNAKKHWSKVTGLPQEKFWVSVGVSRASKGKRSSNALPYGTVQIRVYSRQYFYKVRGHIDGIMQKIRQAD